MEIYHDFIVLGGGPAGLQLAYYLQRDGLDYLVLERGAGPGTFFQHFPRHRMLISINKVHTGSDDPEFRLRHDWNSLLSDDHGFLFSQYDRKFFPDANLLPQYLQDYARHYELALRPNCDIVEIRRHERGYALRDRSGQTFRCRTLIVATGVSQPYTPEIPGIEHAESYFSMDMNPTRFENKRVLIIGKGNSAFETADHLISSAALIHLASPHSLKMAWKTHFVGHLRAVNNNLLDTYQLKSQNAVLDTEIVAIRPSLDGYWVTMRYAHAEDEVEELFYHHVITCTGFRMDTSCFAADSQPEMTLMGRFPCQTSAWESTNLPDLFFAGTLTQTRDFKKTTSGFIHGFRYNAAALFRILKARHLGEPLEYQAVSASRDSLAGVILAAINRSSGLWQQPGFLVDALVFASESCRHYPVLPLDYVHDLFAAAETPYLTVSLEFGPSDPGDPFAVARIRRDNVAKASESRFLHPVLRLFRGRELLLEHHVVEDLEGVWVEPEHTVPLNQFLETCLEEVIPVSVEV